MSEPGTSSRAPGSPPYAAGTAPLGASADAGGRQPEVGGGLLSGDKGAQLGDGGHQRSREHDRGASVARVAPGAAALSEAKVPDSGPHGTYGPAARYPVLRHCGYEELARGAQLPSPATITRPGRGGEEHAGKGR